MKACSVASCIFAHIGWAVALRVTPDGDSAPDISRALDCLRLTTPHLQLQYPADAEAHVEEIRRALPWRPGPHPKTSFWNIEAMWMTKVMGMWDRRSNGTRLADMFGPYVPIFAHFLQPWLVNGNRYPDDMIPALRGVLRRDVPYVAVSQNAEGLPGKSQLNMSDFPNVLVLSGGGYGNIAVPLFNGLANSQEHAEQSSTYFMNFQSKRQPLYLRRYFVSFVGTLGHAPRELRQKVQQVVQTWSRWHPFIHRSLFYKGEGWTDVMMSSRFSLCPRGYGRTSFHLLESIHAGLIPIHIYSDIPWVPYPELFQEKIGFVTTVDGLPALLERLSLMSNMEVYQREATVAQYAKTHFTPDAVIGQLFDFLLWRRGGGDLRCQKFPSTIRDGDQPQDLQINTMSTDLQINNTYVLLGS